jgi:hypothetical protein
LIPPWTARDVGFLAGVADMPPRQGRKHTDEYRAKYAVSSPRGTVAKTGVSSWDTVDAGSIRMVISALTKAGGAIRFGVSRDGGALSVGVYLGDTYFTDWLRPDDDVEQYLEDLVSRVQPLPPGA